MLSKLLLYTVLIFSHILPIIPTLTNISKIVVIADVHADIYRFKTILKDAKILNSNDQWIADPATVVVQLGDQIDPKDPDATDIDDTHHFKMIYFTDDLKKIAKQNNCDFISLVGNHELYNINRVQKKERLREIIAKRPVILQLGEYMFCHGGFNKRHYYMLDIYNKTINDINDIWYKYVYGFELTLNEEIILKNLILDTQNSILFTRTPDSKNDIDKLFNMLNINYMFVGHTTAKYIHLQYKIWYLDMYLKDAFEQMTYQYLIIDGNSNIMIKNLDRYVPFFLNLFD